MSTSLLHLFEQLRARVEEYVDTAYLSNDSAFNEARRQLLLDPVQSPVFRPPLFEPAARYITSTATTDSLMAAANITRLSSDDHQRLTRLLETFPPLGDKTLYVHQEQAIRTMFERRTHFVVTTGTGSGKSYCFQIPVLLGLLAEAIGANGSERWAGPALTQGQWWTQSRPVFSPKRRVTNRRAAVRALIMYPLNALVQDQVDGLRGILNSAAAEDFYDNCLGGERIFFGQYSGSTPGRGDRKPRNIEECADDLRSIQSATDSHRGDADPTVQTLAGSELITRWDMQDVPPDILITNYSMLSIMLLREREQSVLEETRAWLSDSAANRFTLVIDELHSYRGTGGTEISYIIRAFLDRIGLSPSHPQLQIIATSASLSATDGQKFLGDFFGADTLARPFRVIDGPCAVPSASAIDRVRRFRDQFVELDKTGASNERVVGLAEHMARTLGLKDRSPIPVFDSVGLHDAFLIASRTARNDHPSGSKLAICPLGIEAIGQYLFDGDASAAAGFLQCIGGDWACTHGWRAKTRMHLFIRNLDGVRRAMDTSANRLAAPVLYDSAKQVCSRSGAVNLDVHYCQECGELYYFGYRNVSSRRLFVSNDGSVDPNARSEGCLIHIARDDIGYDDAVWSERFFNRFTGEVLLLSEPATVKIRHASAPWNATTRRHDIPKECVACNANWSTRPFVKSPIRSMGTGYNKFSQIVIEQLVGSLRHQAADTRQSKLVIFSDSRRDAALIAADLELNHYLDTVRGLTEERLATDTVVDPLLVSLIDAIAAAKSTGAWDQIDAHPYRQRDPGGFRDLKQYSRGELDPIFDQEAVRNAKAILASAKRPLVRLFSDGRSVLQAVKKDLIELGMNPAGVYQWREYEWQDAFILEPPSQTQSALQELGTAQKHFTDRLARSIREVITSAMGRDFESLGYGWITFDRNHVSVAGIDARIVEMLDVVLRFLSKHYLTRDDECEGYEARRLKTYFASWLTQNSFGLWMGMTVAEVSREVGDLLRAVGAIDERFRVQKAGLYLHPAGSEYWHCGRCRAVHLFRADGRCRTVRFSRDQGKVGCTGTLTAHPIAELLALPNYYRSLSKLGRHKYPLRTEELIGHTDKADQRVRQLAFQGKFFGELDIMA